MRILNIGCGTQTSGNSNVVNVDWSPYLRLRRSFVGRLIAMAMLRGERRTRFAALDANIVVHDLKSGLPFETESVDVVYHSHFLEHLDRGDVEPFLFEVKRVLRSGGVHRIVVPDFETECRRYLDHVAACEVDPSRREQHETYIAGVIEQCVRREANGTSQQPRLRRWFENRVLGDARRRGETHQWMYDRISLDQLLISVGFRNTGQTTWDASRVDGWRDLGLDFASDGSEYKPRSLYVECLK